MNSKVETALIAVLAACAASCGSSAADTVPVTGVTTSGSIAPTNLIDPRVPTYGLESDVDGYRLEATEVANRGGQAIQLELTRDGAPLQLDSSYVHVWAIGESLSFIEHEPRTGWADWMNVGGTGETRIVVSFNDDGANIVLGTTVEVTEPSDFFGGMHNPTQTDINHASGVVVKRSGWSFEVTGSRAQEPQYDYGAWLTLIRDSDLAVSHQSLGQTGDGTYNFDPIVPGSGHYLAILEVAGAPTFTFFVNYDSESGFVEHQAAEALSAVESFVDAINDTDPAVVQALTSARCLAGLPSSAWAEELGNHESAFAEHWLTSAVAEITGDQATITYQTIEGEYVVGETPFWRSRTENWVREDDRWRRDTCEVGYFDW